MAIISASRFIKKEELSSTEPLVLTIKSVGEKENVGKPDAPDMKHVMYFEETEQGLTLNATRISQAVDIFGSNDDAVWIGKQVGLILDPNVKMGTKKVGGIAIVGV